MARSSLKHNFRDLNFMTQFWTLFLFSSYSLNSLYTLEVIIKYFRRKSSIQCNFIMFKMELWQLLVQYHHLHTNLHCLREYVDFLWDRFVHINLLDFVHQHVLKMFKTFFSPVLKVSILFWITSTWTYARIKSYPLYHACTHNSSWHYSLTSMCLDINFLFTLQAPQSTH